jgi:hypothetical protein
MTLTHRDQTSFLEIVRPPEGYTLAYCLGTTYSLDIECLVQLALNASGIEKSMDDISPEHALHAIENFQAKSLVFAQSCRIELDIERFKRIGDTKRKRLLMILDSIVCVVPVSRDVPAFHPKVWIVRFDSKREDPPISKRIVMSRNLTKDYAWDIASIENGAVDNESAKNPNDSTGEFFIQAAKLAALSGKHHKNGLLKTFLADLGSLSFTPPIPAKRSQFTWNSGKAWKIIDSDKYKKMIVISPFLSRTAVENFTKIPDITFVTGLKDTVKLAEMNPLPNIFIFDMDGQFHLHAKMYLGLTKDEDCHLYIGSANCTNRGIAGTNFEAMLFLDMPKSYYKHFQESFIYESISKKKLHPWLTPINPMNLVNQEAEENALLKEALQDYRQFLAQCDFYINWTSISGQTTLKIKEPLGLSRPLTGITGSVEIVGTELLLPLDQALTDSGASLTCDLLSLSEFLHITIQLDSEKLTFCTLARSNMDRASRHKGLSSWITNSLDATQNYLDACFNQEYNANGNARSIGMAASPNADSSKLKIHRTLNPGLLEKLLLNFPRDADVIDRVDRAISNELLDSDEKRALEAFGAIWNEFKWALEEYKKHG